MHVCFCQICLIKHWRNVFFVFRPTNDDVDVLKRELISVQQRMNDMALENEQQIEPLRQTLFEMFVILQYKPFIFYSLVMNIPNNMINSKTNSIKYVQCYFFSY
jgi:hypothetical protein